MRRRLVYLPSFPTVEQALDWAEANGVEECRIYRGPDGRVRGAGWRFVEEVGAVPTEER